MECLIVAGLIVLGVLLMTAGYELFYKLWIWWLYR